MFHTFEIALKLVRALRSLIERIAAKDAALANQLRRAAASVPLNLNEGRRRQGRDRQHHWRIAAGSADEVAATLRVAEAWGYLEPSDIAEPLALCDRVLAMTWRLTH